MIKSVSVSLSYDERKKFYSITEQRILAIVTTQPNGELFFFVVFSFQFPTMQQISEDLIHVLDQLK